MKIHKPLCTFFSIFTLLGASAACSPHKHTWHNYIAKHPTCTEKGLLEKLCEECGEKEYEELALGDHNYHNGACTVCGSAGYAEYEVEPIPMPEGANNTAAISWENLYNIKQTIYREERLTFQRFLSLLGNGELASVYIDNLGFFHATATFVSTKNLNLELPITWSISKVSPTNPKTNKFGNVSTVKVENDQLIVIYSNGVQTVVGNLKNSDTTITGFGLNLDNELIVYYSDNTIAFIGKLSVGKPAESQADCFYRAIDGGYEIMKVLNYNENKIFKIPVSHQGKPIVSITKNAFSEVGYTATSIVIPSTVTNFVDGTFNGLSRNTSIYFEESRETCSFQDDTIMPLCYFQGEWAYVNGIPTPNN